MAHLQKRFTDDQVEVLLNGYCQELLGRSEIQEMPDIGKTLRPCQSHTRGV